MSDTSLRDARVFVTGAAGFLGREVLRRLAAAGADVHAIRFRAEHPADRVTWHQADLLDAVRLRTVLSAVRPEIVFHLAAYGARPGEHDRDRMIAVNVQGSLNLWSALPDTVRRMVMAGTCAEYACADGPVNERYPCDPRSVYAASKHAAVTLLRAFAREDRRALVMLRPFGPYGPGDDSDRVIPFTIRRLVAGETVPLSAGEQLCDFAFVDDHARAFVLAATAALPELAAVYNVGSGRPMVLRSVVEAAADAVGRGARSRLQFGALPYRDGESGAVCADITAARRDLGYEPAVSLEEGLARTVRWIRALVQA